MARATLSRLVPTTASALGMVRAVVSGIFLITVLAKSFSDLGNVSATLIRPNWLMQLLMRFFDILLTPRGMSALKWATVISLALSTIGYLTPLSSKTSALLLLFYEGLLQSFGHFNPDEMLGVYCLIVLAFPPCGDGFSVDSWARKATKKGELAYGFPILLMRLLVALTYFSSALIKLSVGGLSFFEILIVIWELLFPLAVFWKRVRWWILAAGVVFHLSTFFLTNAFFSYQLAMYVVFVNWPKVAAALARTPLLRHASSWWRNLRSVPEDFPDTRIHGLANDGILLWDGDCGFCAAMVQKMKRFVPRPFSETPYQSVSEQLPADVLSWSTRQAHWVNSEGRVSGGSAAVVDLLNDSGRPFLAAILGSAPFRPFLWLGYRLVAIHRGTLAKFVK